jgi:hypothetical protein
LSSSTRSSRAIRILDADFIKGRTVAVANLEPLPLPRNAGIEHNRAVTHPKSEQVFDSCPIHPSGRAHVPGPTAAPHVRRLGVNELEGPRRLTNRRGFSCAAFWLGRMYRSGFRRMKAGIHRWSKPGICGRSGLRARRLTVTVAGTLRMRKDPR